MIEIFKTNVPSRVEANAVLTALHKTYGDYKANFDLEDCDRILRVKCYTENFQASYVVDLLKEFGYHAEILSDEIQVALYGTL